MSSDTTTRPLRADARRNAERVMAAAREALRLDEAPLYARVDLIRDDAGRPCLLELELCEPSLFFAHAPGSAERFAALLAKTLGGVSA